MQAISLNTKRKTQALQLVKIKAKARALNMRVIFHINDILNDFNASLGKILQRVYLTTRISTSLTVQ